MRYVHAEKVLPPELLREVQKHHTGLLYVPGDSTFYEKRDLEIVRLRRQGFSAQEIAERVYLCPRRIRQIIRCRGGSARGNPR